MFTNNGDASFIEIFWSLVGGKPELLRFLNLRDSSQILPSVFDVTSFAMASIGSALLAASELKAVRLSKNDSLAEVELSALDACAAFKGESLFNPIGWNLPPVWDSFAGDYACKDGFIRLHTNYDSHREAVFRVLGTCHSKEELSERISKLEGNSLEQAIISAGGCAALMRTQSSWSTHPHGRFAIQEKMLSFAPNGEVIKKFKPLLNHHAPLQGIRVLDLTRVIAGPVCTKFLSAWGADVLRIDPPGFIEVPALVPETTVGKKRAILDINSPDGKTQFEKLIQQTDILVHGLRPGALENLGYPSARLLELNPSLILASLDAYGWEGPWKLRRGFDSLVQMSTGIAAEGAQQIKSSKPFPLPVQALDHGTGYLMASAVCRALTELFTQGMRYQIEASLVGAANLLQRSQGDPLLLAPKPQYFEPALIQEQTAWGPALRVAAPGSLNGQRTHWKISAGPLGIDPPIFS